MPTRLDETAAVQALPNGKFRGFYKYLVPDKVSALDMTILCKEERETFDEALADATDLMQRRGA